MNPPARAAVFSFDEKTLCQAMDRTQPSLPMVPGRAGTMTHDYKRNGTTDLFAAMNLATGQVLTHCRADHNLKPWRVDSFKGSNDPHFEEKLVDVRRGRSRPYRSRNV